MTLTHALYNAFSGLRANAQAAGLVSTNISNATTEGYGPRSLALTPGVQGSHGGVRIVGVTRGSDPVLLSDRRLADAALGEASVSLAFAKKVEALYSGDAGSGGLADRLTRFESALVQAAGDPSSTQRQENVAYSADALARALNTASDTIQRERHRADQSIADQVSRLNTTMARLAELNDDIVVAQSVGRDTSSLVDERARLVDGVSEIVPLRSVQRSSGEIALFTTGGAVLLDGAAVEIGFEETPAIAADQTLADGALSGLTMNGIAVDPSSDGLFAGGTLSAAFDLRDTIAPAEQARLDGLARELAERLGPGGPDTTLAPGDAGLFTDAGTPVDPANETGLAGRLALNTRVSPASSELWRLRDGLAAPSEGAVGDARLLNGIAEALSDGSVPASPALGTVSRTMTTLIQDATARAAGDRVRLEDETARNSARQGAFREMELAGGVDTDAELQRLMQIEQHYAANAQVMSAVDDMMQRLMAI